MANKIKYLKKDGTEINKLEVANLLATLSDVSTDAKYIGKFFTALDANNIRDAFNTLIDDLVSKGLMVDNGDGTFTPVDMNAIEVAINKKIQITSGDSTNTTRSEIKLLLKDDEAGLVHEATFANILTILGLTQAEFDNIKLDHTVYATIQKLSEQKAAIIQETDAKLAAKSSITLDNVSPADMKKAMAKAGLDVNVFKHELVEYFGKAMSDPKYSTRPDGSALQTGDWFIDDGGQAHIFAHTWHEQQVGIDLTPYVLKAELVNYQVNVGLKDVALPSGDKVVIKETGHFSSNNVSGVRQEATEDYHLIDLQKANELVALKADKNLSNVNVGVANAGKLLQVKADGTIEYITKPKQYSIQNHFAFNKNLIIPADEEIISISVSSYRNDSDEYNGELLQRTSTRWEVRAGGYVLGTVIKNGNTFTISLDRCSIGINVFTRKEI